MARKCSYDYLVPEIVGLQAKLNSFLFSHRSPIELGLQPVSRMPAIIFLSI